MKQKELFDLLRSRGFEPAHKDSVVMYKRMDGYDIRYMLWDNDFSGHAKVSALDRELRVECTFYDTEGALQFLNNVPKTIAFLKGVFDEKVKKRLHE